MSYRLTFRWVIGAPGSVDDIVLSQCRGQGVECYWHQEEVRPDPTATEIPTVWPVMLCQGDKATWAGHPNAENPEMKYGNIYLSMSYNAPVMFAFTGQNGHSPFSRE